MKFFIFVFFIVLVYLINISREHFYSDLKINKCRKDFDFFERLREYVYETNESNFGTFFKNRCEAGRIKNELQKQSFKDEAKIDEYGNLKYICNNLAIKECTFKNNLNSLNVKCHNDYFNWCIDSHT